MRIGCLEDVLEFIPLLAREMARHWRHPFPFSFAFTTKTSVLVALRWTNPEAA